MQITGTVERVVLDYRIGFIGGSRAGTVFANYLVNAGFNVSGFYSQTYDSAVISAQVTHTKAYSSLENLISSSDVVIISVKDAAITDIWHQTQVFNLKNKIICHLSGFLPATVFAEHEKYCRGVAAIHIPISFPSKDVIPNEIYTSSFVVDGSSFALEIIEQISHITKNPLLKIDSANKAQYHAACVLSSSLVLSLLNLATREMQQALDGNISKMKLEKMFLNLAKSALNNALAKDILAVITGPLVRGDREMIKNHIEALSNQTSKLLYKTLSNSLLEDLNSVLKKNLEIMDSRLRLELQ